MERVPLHPSLARRLAERATSPRPDLTVEERRRADYASAPWTRDKLDGPLVHRREVTVPARDGAELLATVYRPIGTEETYLPAVLHAHGGGWTFGTRAHIDSDARYISVGAHVVVVNVEYRLAPEHPFPVPLHDLQDSLAWIRGHADELRISRERLAVSGESAGGNLAASLAILDRDARSEPPLRLQLLEYPALDLRFDSPSAHRNGRGYGLSRQEALWCGEQYRGRIAPTDPRVSPLFADLRGLPRTFLLACGYDILLDDAYAYRDKLERAGVPVELHLRADMTHGGPNLTRWVPSELEWAGIRSSMFARVLHAL